MSTELRCRASCQTCGEETNYRCLSCAKPICNRSNNCSIAAPEETTGWKAGSFVSFCVPCKARPAANGKESLPRGAIGTKNGTHTGSEINKKTKARQDSQSTAAAGSHLQKKRKCLDLSQKVAVLEFAKEHPTLGSRKIADQFKTGKTQIQAILRSKQSIMATYESNTNRNQAKRSRTAKNVYHVDMVYHV